MINPPAPPTRPFIKELNFYRNMVFSTCDPTLGGLPPMSNDEIENFMNNEKLSEEKCGEYWGSVSFNILINNKMKLYEETCCECHTTEDVEECSYCEEFYCVDCDVGEMGTYDKDGQTYCHNCFPE